MKKLILTVAVFTLIAGSNLMAQSVNEDVAVTATVVNTLTITSTDVAFGNVNSGSSAYVNAGTGDPTASTNASGATAGTIDIDAESGAQLTITFTNGSLTDSGGLNSTLFTPTVVFNDLPLPANGEITLTGVNGIANVGGTLAAINGGAGTYSTANGNGVPVTFTVLYTSI